ncbi:glycosyltransferase family 4 protein [Chloroflexota bacterium]
MRICYLGDSNCLHDFRFIKKLVDKGYDTHVVTFTSEPMRIEGARYFQFPQLEEPSKHSRPVGGLISLGNTWRYRSFLRKLLKEIKPDVLHAGWIPSHGQVAAISGFHPFLLMPWGSDILILPNSLRSNKIITRYVIKKADMITCDAEYVKREIVRLSGYPEDKIIVFPWGIDLSKFNTEVDGSEIRARLGWQSNNVLIMTRIFEPNYGIQYFLQAMPKIVSQHPEVRTILCGDGSLRRELESFVEDKGLKNYVYFAGFIENDDLPPYLASADIYVSSSLTDGTSLSLLEAMACGLPVVVSDVPAILEWIRDDENGFTVPRRDATSLEKNIVRLLEREDLRKKFGQRNWRITQERAHWDKNFERLEWIYRELAGNRKGLNQ